MAPSEGPPALETRSLVVRYPGAPAPTLAGLSLRVPVGARVALVGPNGAGKSTLLKAAAGLLRPQGGTIEVFGAPPGSHRARVAYLPQRGDLDWRFPITVRRLVVTGRYARLGWLRRPGRADRAAADTALERVGLLDLAEHPIGRLSGGQQQRVLLARALAQEADLLLLDEPLDALDAATRGAALRLLEGLPAEGRTWLMATHDARLAATAVDQVIRLGALAPGAHPLPDPGPDGAPSGSPAAADPPWGRGRVTPAPTRHPAEVGA
jgi:manganese/zinc/iron transport system ATP- binding protein